MSWSYDNTNLNTATEYGRLNVVRLLIFDTDSSDQHLQDEEILFAVSENNNRVYQAAAFCADLLRSKYSTYVDTEVDGSISAKYSQLAENFRKLSTQLSFLSKSVDGNSLGIYAGGVSKTTMESVESLGDRVKPQFTIEQFRNSVD